MNLSVTGHHVEVTDPLKDYVEEKMEKLERHFDKVADIHVILNVEKLRQQAEATIDLTGTRIHAEAENEDMYAAIDALVDKLDRQVLKHKEKLRDHHRREKLNS
ncbi:MAG: ribosome-associated translation inhibitor RaiA [Halofilum sp. (in: g-proteobacteria)]|nr:ribosome-associated translation inhibitor RaiA [Halofilum sp. (in: g-proteobacteria)]